MSIAPPSDIVLDVAQAADPTRVQAAAAKLASMAGTAASDIDFASVLQARSRPILNGSDQASRQAPEITRGHQMHAAPGSTYQKFEAVVLQNFIQEVLPKNTELFGDAFSGDAYRSMLAEQIAAQVAKSGRLGIAQTIEKKEASLHPAAAPSVPDPAATLPADPAATLLSQLPRG
ncbi:rod-binding protein [Lichenihabitans sp. Uapishka_5]|uniref:rod-binding protein n=1 Tax=Lichenihabitans sp. Uapishka_5 TaxID=3037302 RepID=UPI0029E7D6D6|nr:rod-binding protein [Lichenihabitans sp. Uapishka_5]MDX7950356.1 rod-binding protein [Lichenihabitans sp. Uapishka_5]